MSRKTNKHKIFNKLTGRQMETIYVSVDEMVELVDRHFIIPAVSQEERLAVWKNYQGKMVWGS